MPQSAPGFTFAAANAKKLRSLPGYAFGSLLTYLVPRNRDLWAFGSGSGIGEGALELYLHARTAGSARRLVWLARNRREAIEANRLGMRVVTRSSLRGFVTTLRAGVIVVTHGLGDANRYVTRGAFVVQLWHGIPYKRIHLDSAQTVSTSGLPASGLIRRVLRRMYRLAASTISLVPAASELSAGRLRSAFALPHGKVVVTGDPRDDVLVRGEHSERRDRARADLFEKLGLADSGQRVVLYAPTWRDGEPDPGVPSTEEWERISAWLAATDSILVVRPHPLGVGDYRAGLDAEPRAGLLDSRTQADITPALPAVDLLVTDYSSIAYDFALTGRPIAFLAPDLDRYGASHGVYEPYPVFSGGSEVSSWDGLVALLENPATLPRLAAHSERLAERHHAFRDGRNTERVHAEIIRRISATGPGSLSAPVETAPHPQVDRHSATVRLTHGKKPQLVVEGSLDVGDPVEATLEGARQQVAGTLGRQGDRWTATFPLTASRWGGPELAVPSGRYRLALSAANGVALPIVLSPFGPELMPGLAVIVTEAGTDGSASVVVSAPLTASERGPRNQEKLEAAYRSNQYEPEDAIFFESFYGQNASCNPLALDRAVAELLPNVRRYWSVVDASVETPPGAVPLVEGSEEWWRIRGTARLLIVNDWLRKRYRKRRHQKVVQTWHGTPLKKIALSRPRVGPRTVVATLRERARWDLVLAQNPHSASAMRSAYAWLGPIWEEGYPRDDVLTRGTAPRVRDRLQLPDDVTVVLYAPTWRDDRPGEVDYLDVAAFAAELGPGYRTLIRGHSRSLKPGRDVHAPNVLDVTGYPDVSELFLVADLLVTDYSSVMFDFSVTGRPIFFYAPDLEHYREQLRGFYFDLEPVAPGPLVRDPAELVALVRDRDAVAAKFAARYSAWRERFNPRDDGGAAHRVLRRLIDEGMIG